KIPSPYRRNRAMADTSFRALPPPNPKQPQLRLRGTNRTIWMASSHRRHPLDPPQCLVHAEHEILIFLYFEKGGRLPSVYLPRVEEAVEPEPSAPSVSSTI